MHNAGTAVGNLCGGIRAVETSLEPVYRVVGRCFWIRLLQAVMGEACRRRDAWA